ncbi:hypothetical protein EVAR_25068_1 [Eumeta japonica]|uniref:Uncharacterized protein n=1 Tax=Eumeta variegata TaxID=151549 RepID=A0A4C1V915_EUMVA|nr:hypothetical protein EVAR_25068_1 [Eumeta japonica]
MKRSMDAIEAREDMQVHCDPGILVSNAYAHFSALINRSAPAPRPVRCKNTRETRVGVIYFERHRDFIFLWPAIFVGARAGGTRNGTRPALNKLSRN